MIIVGAGGHAAEVLDILPSTNILEIYFFDDINISRKKVFGYSTLSTLDEARTIIQVDKRVILGTGGVVNRRLLANKFIAIGGELLTVIAETAFISKHNTSIGVGTNIMHFTFISSDVQIGEGCLVNSRVNIHHNVVIGDYCEISPSVLLLGNVVVGSNTFIGAGATILPGISIGENCIIGGGALVNKNVASYTTVKGVPAK